MWALARSSVVPTMRVLYFIAFLSMTAKFVILFVYSKETSVGVRRLAITKIVSIFRSLTSAGTCSSGSSWRSACF